MAGDNLRFDILIIYGRRGDTFGNLTLSERFLILMKIYIKPKKKLESDININYSYNNKKDFNYRGDIWSSLKRLKRTPD